MSQYVSITGLLQSTEPLVVAAISDATTLLDLASNPPESPPCDVIELRLDAIHLSIEELIFNAKKLTKPLLITARDPEEGGQGNLDLKQRTALLSAVLPLAGLMDVELRNVPDMIALIRKAQNQRVAVIASFHDFNSTPSEEVLRGAVDFGLQFKMDAVKLATQLRSPDDLARLLHVLTAEKRLPLSIMGMGPLGRVSRLLLAKCGSVLNYGYLGTPNAPGQLPARRLKELIQEL